MKTLERILQMPQEHRQCRGWNGHVFDARQRSRRALQAVEGGHEPPRQAPIQLEVAFVGGDARLALDAAQRAGPEAIAWLVENHSKLEDPDQCEVFIKEPQEIIWELKSLEIAAAELRSSRRLSPQSVANPAEWDAKVAAIIALVVGLVGVLLWKWKKPQAP